MRTYLVKRFLLLIPTLIGISLISFLIIQLAPGDPATMRLGSAQGARSQALAEQIIQETRALYGLDRPLHEQYLSWLGRIATFDFGNSIRDQRPVLDKLKERVPVSIQLGGISLILAYLISIPLGIYSATHQYSRTDKVTTVFLFMLYSLPNFWVATLAIVYLGGGDFLDVFPVFGLQTIGSEGWTLWERFADRLWHLVLPVTCMTYYTLAAHCPATCVPACSRSFARISSVRPGQRVSAKAPGHLSSCSSKLPDSDRDADGGPVAGALIGGSIVIETIFSVPGMGQLIWEAVLSARLSCRDGRFYHQRLPDAVGNSNR